MSPAIPLTRASRPAAALIAAVAWLGLAVQCAVLYPQHPSIPAVLWIVFGYFTILTNLLIAFVFTGIAAGSATLRSVPVVAASALYILLVGITYALLLHGSIELSGGSALANVILHRITPVLVPIFWLAITPKGSLTSRHPLLWAIYPLAYLGYLLARGRATGHYAYPFLDLPRLGLGRTATNASAIAVAFILSSYAIVWLDHRLGARAEVTTSRSGRQP